MRLASIQENIPLAKLTTMKVGGDARFFCTAKNTQDLVKAVTFAQKENLPIFILGSGSNIIVSDEGLKGLVIKMEIEGVRPLRVADNNILLVVSAGENWDHVVEYAVNQKLYGIENLSAIPGTVGAVPIQNIGAYGMEVGDVIEWVEVFNTKTMEFEKLFNEECAFGYRDSIFKKDEGKDFIVTQVAFLLQRNGELKTDYKDIRNFFEGHRDQSITLSNLRDAVVRIRTAKLPDHKKVGTVGSFFKNPHISRDALMVLKKKYPELPFFISEDNNPDIPQLPFVISKSNDIKIPLAWILDKVCGLGGFREGNVGLHPTQPLALIHYGGGSCREIDNFAKKIEDKVMKATGIEIVREVSFVK